MNRLLVAALAAVSLVGAARAEPGGADYAQPHRLVDIGEGRRLNLFCLGQGRPTVVFDSDAGRPGWDWLLVQPEVARTNQACVYDRAGLGFSDPSPQPGMSDVAVADLHALLGAAGMAPPYLLVGQGYGGMNAQLYAYSYPTDTAGLVIIDAPHEDETARLDAITGGRFSQAIEGNLAFLRDCAAGANFPACAESQLRGRSAYGPALSGAVLDLAGLATFWQANASEEGHLPLSADTLRAARESFGNLPLAYLTRGVSPYGVPGHRPSPTNKAIEAAVKAMHDEIAALSTRGSDRIAPGAGHDIQIDRPAAVVAAIRSVLAER